MADRKVSSVVSDEILMKFMEKIEDSVSSIEKAVSENSKTIALVEKDLHNHIQDEKKVGEVKTEYDRKTIRYLSIIGILVVIISMAMGYIWGDKQNVNSNVKANKERLQERPKDSTK